MPIVIYLLAGIGALALFIVLMLIAQQVIEFHRDNIHRGLQDQIARLGETLALTMQEQGCLSHQAVWLIDQFTYTARTRHSRVEYDLSSTLHEAMERQRGEESEALRNCQSGNRTLSASLDEARKQRDGVAKALDTLTLVVGLTPIAGNRDAMQEAMDAARSVLASLPADLTENPTAFDIADADASDRPSDRYFIKDKSRSDDEREVSKEEYIQAERRCGFRSKFGPDSVATASFCKDQISGRVKYANQHGVQEPPACPKCHKTTSMVKHGDTWVCHSTHPVEDLEH